MTTPDNNPEQENLYDSKKQVDSSSIRLSVLNPAVRERVQKFDIGNDGALDIEEAVQGLITLQKQSNNYKKMIWFLIPIIALVLAGSFGTTILAINLTKDVKQSNGLLTASATNTPIRTLLADSRDMMYNSMFSDDFNLITKIHLDQNTIDVRGIYQTRLDDQTRAVYVNSDMVHFAWNQTGEFAVYYNTGFENNLVARLIYEDISNSLMLQQIRIQAYRLSVKPELFNIYDISQIMSRFPFMVSTSKVNSQYQYEQSAGVALSTTSRGLSALFGDDKPCDDYQKSGLCSSGCKTCSKSYVMGIFDFHGCANSAHWVSWYESRGYSCS